MPVKQIVINKDKHGRMTDITLFHEELNKGPTILSYDKPIIWNPRIPMPDRKCDMAKVLRKKKK